MIRTKEFKSKPYITREMIASVIAVMNEGTLSGYSASDPDKLNGGKYVQDLERKWAEYHKVKYAIAVNSATSGLITALRALEIGSGDEVITTPFTFSASWASIKLVGATPVFADVDLSTMCILGDNIGRKQNDVTKAVLSVQWNSNPCTPTVLGMPLIEDLAQCAGTPLRGDIGVYSLNQPKNIMCGEGGVIVTNDAELDRRCRLIRNHGENIDPDWIGYNFRMTEIQAVIASCQLDELHYLNNIRHRNWLYLCDQLEEYKDILVPQLITNRETYSPYCAAFRWLRKGRNIVADVLRQEGIPVATGVPVFPPGCLLNSLNAWELQYFQYLGFYQIGWPNTYEDMWDIVKGFKKII